MQTSFRNVESVGLLSMALLSQAAIAQSDPGVTRKPVECIAEIDRSVGHNKINAIVDDILRGDGRTLASPAQLVEQIDRKRSRLCTSLVELERYQAGTPEKWGQQCILRTRAQYDALTRAEGDYTYDKLLQFIGDRCASKMSAQDLLDRIPRLARAHSDALEREAKATKDATEKQARAAQLEHNKTRVRNFEIKGLGLSVTKQKLLALGMPKNDWRCQPDTRFLSTEICVVTFEVKSCYDVEAPVAAGLGWRRTQKCDTSFRPVNSVSPGLHNLMTLGGVKVESAEVSFYEGRTQRVNFFVSKVDLELKAGLAQKWGAPDVESERQTRWEGLDEVMSLGPGVLSIERPSLIADHNQKVQQVRETKQADEQLRVKRESDRKKDDI